MISQRQLEVLLDPPSGYLMRLLQSEQDAQHGKSVVGVSNAALVGTLALLARDPHARVHELREFWEWVCSNDSYHAKGHSD